MENRRPQLLNENRNPSGSPFILYFRPYEDPSKINVDWINQFKGRVFQLTSAVSSLEAFATDGVPVQQEIFEVKLGLHDAIGVGARAVVIGASLWSPALKAYGPFGTFALRMIRSKGLVHEMDRYMHSARARLGLAIHRSGNRYLGGILAHGQSEGIEFMELVIQHVPMSVLLSDRCHGEILNIAPALREQLIGSFLKSIFTSIESLNGFQKDYVPSIPGSAAFQFPLVLVHGDIKLENLLLDLQEKSIRLIDFDGLAVLSARRDPVKVAPNTTMAFAPPELVQGLLGEKSDCYMAAISVLRLFFSDNMPRIKFNTQGVASMLRLNQASPVVKIMVDCLQSEYRSRCYPSDALAALESFSTDAAATFLCDLYTKYTGLDRIVTASRKGDLLPSSTAFVAKGLDYPESAKPQFDLGGSVAGAWKTASALSFLQTVDASPPSAAAGVLKQLQVCDVESRRQILYDFIVGTESFTEYARAASASWILRGFLKSAFQFDERTNAVSKEALEGANANLNKVWPSRKKVNIDEKKLALLLQADAHKLGHVFVKIGLQTIEVPGSLQEVRDRFGFFGDERTEAVKVLIATFFVHTTPKSSPRTVTTT